MNTTGRLALSGFALVMIVIGNVCWAVDANRAAEQARRVADRSAPSNNFSTDTQGDLRFGGAAAANPSGPRNRVNDASQPSWFNNPGNTLPTASLLGLADEAFQLNPDNGSTTLQRWRLGIYPQDTDTGVRITEVVGGTAAERAGLEVNDRIVSVHGYQVGYVNNVLYDCGQEFERHADATGWVNVLVQNQRDGKLVNLPIQLDARYNAITGTITYQDRSALPRDAVATVELREVFRAGVRPVIIARQSITNSRQVPIPFTLDYDPNEITPGRSYVLHATITAGGRQIYGTRQDYPVLDNRPTTGLQLLVESTTLPSFNGTLPNREQQMAQIASWFRDYLRREPRPQELYVWEAHLDRGGSLADAQLQILSTPEFFYQSNADDTQYVRRMFQLVAGRQPNEQEVGLWVDRLRYHNQLRPQVASEFLAWVNPDPARTGRR